MLNAKLFSSVLIAGALLSGCVTTSLKVTSKMTQSIFVEPVAASKKLIFLSVKNTSGHDVNLEGKLREALRNKGYTFVDDPKQATYILSTNVLYCDEKRENNAAVGAAIGAATGAGVGVYNYDSVTGGVVSTGVGALAGGLVGKLTEDTIWQMQVDINIRQKADGKVLASSGSVAGQAQVNDGKRAGFLNTFSGPVRGQNVGSLQSNQVNTQSQIYEKDYIEHQTIIFAEAVKWGLELPEATPILENRIASQVAGLF
ncbi:MAG: complement resistance protein TraT [Helicobacter sp.]|nr:complement resistance protein TraT [Helicobacteraceae bacterium]MDY3112976.1 complement resistance protein TraT [Helicobacter sp.]